MNVEPTRYWLLCSGILLVFLGSQIGQIICLRVFNIVRSAYYMALALLAACGALFFYGLGRLFLGLAIWIKNLRANR